MSDSIQRPVPFNLNDDARDLSITRLQGLLPALIGLSLRLKQAHWNLRGARFKSVHEQLDEILVDVRQQMDDVAERVVTLGGAADGLAKTVAESEPFEAFPKGLLTIGQSVRAVGDDVAATIRQGRECIALLGEVDPVSEDLAIGVVGSLEKHHWMLLSQLDPNDE